MRQSIIIATTKSWNIENAYRLKEQVSEDYDVFIITNPDDLKLTAIQKISPKYIFFPHWSWIIIPEIYENFNCIVFHMTNLPFGRGGSPMQNLIVRKIYQTKISAIKVVKELDAGDIYLKVPFSLEKGSAQELFSKMANMIFSKMIPNILDKDPEAMPQQGLPVIFKRRKPSQSDITSATFSNLVDWYDFIRMLDAEGYPNAFINIGRFTIRFTNVDQMGNKVIGKFEIEEANE